MARRPLTFWDGLGVGLIFVWIVVFGIAALVSVHVAAAAPPGWLVAIPIALTLVLVALRLRIPASRFTILIVGLGVTIVCTAAFWA